MLQVYLAGPISGLNYDGATDWREQAKDLLSPFGIKTLSPLRNQEHMRKIGIFTNAAEETARLESPMSTPKGLTIRDRWDAMRCDVLLVNLLGAKTVSIGTVMEIAWADSKGIPIVAAIEPTTNPHEHAMLMHCIGYRVPTLWDACDVTRQLLAC
ncbi:nucleoside 2-deoxyribosyltransferase [Bradyrhizobium pachyrhizi]|uniref:nucleoside 2-deoxyribosyltransferase n=1 Tax=Bradyrhizobium pachyrhizi TaxID=280333 RepID=UPI0024B0E373|nr:nucleoside 2-deoxyribosyltransferase [Bradyrhizobium pachyrhizi]WFU52334.1 nucleoside 2-deoxyribosyltransferase [Bradyrhizobium pachyrhizi]